MKKGLLVIPIISIVCMCIIILITFFGFNKIDKEMNQVKKNPIVEFTLDINTSKVVIKTNNDENNRLVGSQEIILKAKYLTNQMADYPVMFKIIMIPFNDYNKTVGMSNKYKEYTYEIKNDNNNILKRESQISSYKANDEIILFTDSITPSAEEYIFYITFNYYLNPLNEENFDLNKLKSNISVRLV